jgi:3D (Asp-Asp-Asp) domain-containing protein
MEKKTASAIMMSLLVLGTLALVFNIQEAKASGGVTPVGLEICELGTAVTVDDPIFSPFSDEYMLTGSEGGSAFYFPSNKDGTFGSRSVVYDARSVDGIAMADFDNDGDLDFVLGDGNTDSIVLFRNDGSGVFTLLTIATAVLGATPFFSQFRAADFNGDGRMDFVAGGFTTSPERQFAFINQGGNTFVSYSIDVSWRSGCIFVKDVGDFDNDGKQDILIGDVYGGFSGKVYFYKGKGDGTFETPTLAIDLLADHGQRDPIGLAADDFDLDGKLDVVIGGDGTTGEPHGEFWFYKGNGDGTFTAGASVFNLKGVASLGQVGADAYDFDKDMKPDVVGYNWDGRQVWFVKGRGDGTFESALLIDSLPSAGAGIAAPARALWTPTPTIRYVIPTAIIKVRSYPGIPENDANVITKLPKGSVLQIVEHPDNGKFVDGYHWWYVKFGIVKGWVAEEYVKEYDFQKQQSKTLNDVSLTAYHVCYEGEMAEGPTVINPPKISGAFYKKFLYSAKGVVMQGSGRAIDGRVIKYVNGGGGWVNQEGQRTYLRNDYTWSNGPPYWIANEESVIFEELPENTYKGAYWDVYPWYSIATDPTVIPPGTIVYIKELDGLRLSNGETLNGYFVAADTGGAIKGNRIDVFVGAGETALLDWPGNFKANIKYDDSTAWKRIQAKLKSPGELRVYDSQGNVTGVVNGEVKVEIPDSSYDYVDNAVTLVFPTDSYRYLIVGTGEGLYGLTLTSVAEQEIITFAAADIPTTANATHQYTVDWIALSQGEEGVTVEVDSDGDGVFEHTFASDSELTQTEFLSQIAPPLSVSISPLSASILVGQSVTFTSTVSGGYPPYSYQWCLNGNPVSGATSASWTFTQTTSGIYYAYLKVTDAKANTAQSGTARIAVATVPVGGYSIPIQVPTKAEPIIPYIALIVALTVVFTKLKPKTKRKR